MARLKNITSSVISLQMFRTSTPYVNYIPVDVILSLKPGEDVDQNNWLVSNINDPSYNLDLIEDYIKQGVLTRLNV